MAHRADDQLRAHGAQFFALQTAVAYANNRSHNLALRMEAMEARVGGCETATRLTAAAPLGEGTWDRPADSTKLLVIADHPLAKEAVHAAVVPWIQNDAGLPVDAAESKLVVLATRLIGLDLGVKKQS